MVHHCNGKYTIVAVVVFFMVNQLNHRYSWAVVRTFVAMGCNKTYASGVTYKPAASLCTCSSVLPRCKPHLILMCGCSVCFQLPISLI